MVPLSASIAPAISRISVVFPAPEGPSRQRISPENAVRPTSCSTRTGPKDLLRFLISIFIRSPPLPFSYHFNYGSGLRMRQTPHIIHFPPLTPEKSRSSPDDRLFYPFYCREPMVSVMPMDLIFRSGPMTESHVTTTVAITTQITSGSGKTQTIRTAVRTRWQAASAAARPARSPRGSPARSRRPPPP